MDLRESLLRRYEVARASLTLRMECLRLLVLIDRRLIRVGLVGRIIRDGLGMEVGRGIRPLICRRDAKEEFCDALVVAERGGGSAEDLAAWRAAELTERGVQHKLRYVQKVYGPRRNRFAYVVEVVADGRVERFS